MIMLVDYLVTSTTRRRLLELLWRDGFRATAQQLALLGNLSFATVHGELQVMLEVGLVSRTKAGRGWAYEANRRYRDAKLMLALVGGRVPVSVQMSRDELADALAELGAPILAPGGGASPSSLSAERVLSLAVKAAHDDASIARVLPFTLARNAQRLDFARLAFFCRELDEARALGMFLDLGAALSGQRKMSKVAAGLRDGRVSRSDDFFTRATSAADRELAELNSPPQAKRWKFRMNMPLDMFATLFEKFAVDHAHLRH